MHFFCFFTMVQLKNFFYDNKNDNDNSKKTCSLKLLALLPCNTNKMVTTLQKHI